MEKSVKGSVVGQSKVYANFRVSINEIKEKLKVREGDRVMFISEGDRVYIKKIEP